MHQALRFILVGSVAALLIACSGEEEFIDAGGDGADGGGQTLDASTRHDGGGDPGEVPDAATRSDGGAHPDGGGSLPACAPTFGMECGEDSDCAGLQCATGYCAPQGRDDCGGFAGWTCPRNPGSPETVCLFYPGTDFGVCVTPEEHECLCANHPENVNCSD